MRALLSHHIRRLLVVLLPLLAAVPCKGIEKSVGTNELIVYRPLTDERGRAKVKIHKKGNKVQVEFAPTVHVHRNYYAGPKNFQGPVVQGGRTIVVARHPKCGDTVYVDLNLPSGLPRIHHYKSSISYVYKDRRVLIHFNSRNPKATRVRIVTGKGFFRRAKELHAKVVAHTNKTLKKSQTLNALTDLGKKGTQTAGGLVGQADQQLGQLLSGLSQLTSLLPGGIQADGVAQDLPTIRQQATEKAAATQAKKGKGLFGLFK